MKINVTEIPTSYTITVRKKLSLLDEFDLTLSNAFKTNKEKQNERHTKSDKAR